MTTGPCTLCGALFEKDSSSVELFLDDYRIYADRHKLASHRPQPAPPEPVIGALVCRSCRSSLEDLPQEHLNHLARGWTSFNASLVSENTLPVLYSLGRVVEALLYGSIQPILPWQRRLLKVVFEGVDPRTPLEELWVSYNDLALSFEITMEDWAYESWKEDPGWDYTPRQFSHPDWRAKYPDWQDRFGHDWREKYRREREEPPAGEPGDDLPF